MSELNIDQAFHSALEHHQAGRLSEAETLYRQILVQRPKHAPSLHHLGVIASQAGHPDAAVELIRRSIALQPNIAEAHNNLGNPLRDIGQLDEAIVAFRQAIAIKPNLPQAYCNLGNAMKDKGQLDDAIAAYRQAVVLQPDYAAAHGNVVYLLHFHPGYDATAIAEEHRRWNHQHAQPLERDIQPHLNDRNPAQRLRIGYVSPDFREHPVGRFLLPLLSNHDKTKVEIFAYSQTCVADAMTQQLSSHVDQWRNVMALSDHQLADLIRQDKIDILVDLTMHMADNRLMVFARKPAPVQVTYLAFCSSTGLQTIDYRLSDPYLDPPGTDESIYSEQTIRLPQTYWCYQPIITVPQVSTPPALEKGFITFGSLNNFCKVSEPALTTWAKLLLAAPKSQLLLHARHGDHRKRVLDRLEREGIDSNRVRFAGFMSHEDYFNLYQLIDIALDSFPFAGGTTTCDALWMGVPVITLAGKTAVGRGGVSILSNIGLPELIAHSTEQYIHLAKELAQDIPKLSNLRSTLRARMKKSPLMDTPRFARNIESAYRKMWQTWCGNPERRGLK